MIRGPGIMKNKTVNEINVNIDIAPTMIEMSGQTINPDKYDGISLLPFVMDEYENRINQGKFFMFLSYDVFLSLFYESLMIIFKLA